VPGTFAQFAGTITVDRDQLQNSSVDATVQIGSVTTGNDKRDAHLKSPDFFDAAKYGTATFKSKSFKKTGDTTYAITGDLTLHGVTKEIVLNANLLGFGDGMQGAKLVGWEATTTIKRSDFGLSGPAMLSKALGDDAALTINIEADKK
jgi:polyisoprenoid-binding protein YceI